MGRVTEDFDSIREGLKRIERERHRMLTGKDPEEEKPASSGYLDDWLELAKETWPSNTCNVCDGGGT
jgi:hypothetical protein